MVFVKLSNKDTFFQNLEEIILYFYNIKNKVDNFSQSNVFLYEKEKLKKVIYLNNLAFYQKCYSKKT